ncbi:class I SAM-dependent methyltransferase [Solidesulfovibrio sp. C21]|uniref:class I SAM-dependent methyltransferase n=1 Tax=Solidesulfovibrio sp. C21 TaxID=3398613 RepID=UPI0039FD7DE7
MDRKPLFRRASVSFDKDVLADPAQGIALARTLWARQRFEIAMDLYDRLAQVHHDQAVSILAEAYDRFQEITPCTRYRLYQSRFFDFPIAPGDTVLDMGSGHIQFPLATHIADISLTDSVDRLGDVDGKPAFEVRMEETGFADKQFDFVYCSHVLEHATDPAAACRELARIGRRGYIETPTKGKDAFLGGAQESNHRWHVELVYGVLVFTEYEARDLEGFGVDLLRDMHVAPRTDREKALSALLYLRADQCNTMFGWEGTIPCEVRRPQNFLVQVAPPQPVESKVAGAGNVRASKDSVTLTAKASVVTLASRLEKLARLGADPKTLDILLGEVLAVLRELVAQHQWDQAVLLGAATKALRRPVRGLDMLRALTFHGQGSLSAARESLKEELRYFPDNAQAVELLRAVEAAEAQAAAAVAYEPDLAAIMPVVRRYTMVAPPHLASLFHLARKACRNDLPGDFAECGVAAGGTSAMLAYAIKRYSQRPRVLHCFDTFSGMPDPGDHDVHAGTSAQDTGWGAGTCAAPEDNLREACRALDAEDIIRPVKGFFRDTLPKAASRMQGLALLHMDGDWYESTRDILVNLYDRIVPGGLVQVDDYGYWEGCRKAMTEFFQERGLRVPLRPIPGGGGVWFRVTT